MTGIRPDWMPIGIDERGRDLQQVNSTTMSQNPLSLWNCLIIKIAPLSEKCKCFQRLESFYDAVVIGLTSGGGLLEVSVGGGLVMVLSGIKSFQGTESQLDR